VIASQDEIHKKFGGVVPELAGRRHIEVISGVAQSALDQAGLKLDQIEGVAVTKGPGLVVCLLAI
jgi:N6-L-threonylcarbamoyladenine synthase